VDGMLHVKLQTAKDAKHILVFLAKADTEVFSVRLVEPTLEQAFVELVNHA
jgi:hypothetical protein